MTEQQVTIGFANVNERTAFPIAVREGLETAAAEHNLRLIVRNNDDNSDRALAHAHEFADIPVDLAILYHVDQRVGPNLRAVLAQKGIPVIAVTFPIPLAVYFAVDYKKAGLMAGETLGTWIQSHWDGQVDKVLMLTDARILSGIRLTLDSGLAGLQSRIAIDHDDVFYIDGGTDRQLTADRTLTVLRSWVDYTHIAAICINDDSALGVLDAARALGRAEQVAIIGQNASLAVPELRNPGSRVIATVDFHPEQYGPALIDLALRMLRGERVPRENYLEPTCITADGFFHG